MNEEERWQQLKGIRVEPSKKQQDFERITERLEKNGFYWQIPVVVIGILMIAFFLFITVPDEQRVTTDDTAQLTAVYRLYGEGNPQSIWQMGVSRTTHPNALQQVTNMMNHLEPIDTLGDGSELSETVRLVYSDQTSALYQTYFTDTHMYFYQMGENNYYELPNISSYHEYFLYDYNDAKKYAVIVFVLTLVLLVLNYFIGRKMREPEDKKRQLPAHSTHWQTVLFVVSIVIVSLLVLFCTHIHYFIIVGVIGITTVGNVWLEGKYGQNNWRKLSLVMNATWYLAILLTLFFTLA